MTRTYSLVLFVFFNKSDLVYVSVKWIADSYSFGSLSNEIISLAKTSQSLFSLLLLQKRQMVLLLDKISL